MRSSRPASFRSCSFGGDDRYHPRVDAIKCLSDIDQVVRDKRPVVRTLLDAGSEHLDKIDSGIDTITSETFEQFYFYRHPLKSCTGEDFGSARFHRDPRTRARYRKAWQDWWDDNGDALPEVDPPKVFVTRWHLAFDERRILGSG